MLLVKVFSLRQNKKGGFLSPLLFIILYTNELYIKISAQSEIKVFKIPFAVASQNIKYLEINSQKLLHALYTENYKILLREK